VGGAGPDLGVLVLVIVVVGFALSLSAIGVYLILSSHDDSTGITLIVLGIAVMLAALGVYIAYVTNLKTSGPRAVSESRGSQSG